MDGEIYTILSLAARYLFAGLLFLMLLQAALITRKDNSRAARLRRMAEETGAVATLRVSGIKEPLLLPKDGLIGSSSRCDVVLQKIGVERFHAHFEYVEGGMLFRPMGNAKMSIGKEHFTGKEIYARNGDTLYFARSEATLYMQDKKPAARKTVRPKRDDDLFEVHKKRKPNNDPFDEDFFMEDDKDDEKEQ